MQDYIEQMPGLSKFARIPIQALTDPDIGPRQLLVFCVIASHANIEGNALLSQARIAEMCGFLTKGRPDNALVSRLISNPKYKEQQSGLGPGLVELGYIEKKKQVGINQVKGYRLKTPQSVDGFALRPDGSPFEFRIPTYRHSKEYKSEKKQEIDSIERIKAASDPSCVFFDDFLYFEKDIAEDIQGFHEGLNLEIPAQVYAHFKIDRPTNRDGYSKAS